MAKLLTTRHWGSEESFNYLGKTFRSRVVKPQESSNNEKTIMVIQDVPAENPVKQAPKRKAVNVASKMAKSKISKPFNEIFLEPSHVRASALLYEITERTNQLAQPRVRVDAKPVQERPNASQIVKASPRIIELSKPRYTYHHRSKPVGYVTPAALTAVATQRIIELSKPKRKRRLKVSSKRRSKLLKDKSRYVRYARKRPEYKSGSFQRRSDRRFRSRRKQCSLRTTNSQRSIIVVGRNLKDSKKNRRHL